MRRVARADGLARTNERWKSAGNSRCGRILPNCSEGYTIHSAGGVRGRKLVSLLRQAYHHRPADDAAKHPAKSQRTRRAGAGEGLMIIQRQQSETICASLTALAAREYDGCSLGPAQARRTATRRGG